MRQNLDEVAVGESEKLNILPSSLISVNLALVEKAEDLFSGILCKILRLGSFILRMRL